MKFVTGAGMDEWQEKVMNHKGNMSLRCGRQVGKSETVSEKAWRFALENTGTTTLVIAASQRQSALIFEKIKGKLDMQHNDLIEKALKSYKKKHGKDPDREMRREIEYTKGLYEEAPTLTKVLLLNKSRIYCLPVGKTGVYIRGFTIDLLIADEAAYIPETVWLAIMPMIAVSRKLRGFGWIILLSTPFGKGGFFYNSCHDPDFMQIHQTSEKCERIPRDFLRKERQRLTKLEYAQEYLAEFVDEFTQLFPTALIKSRMTFMSWDLQKDYNPKFNYYLGVDFARFGGDENAFIVAELDNEKRIRIIKVLATERKSITDTCGFILKLHADFKFKKIFVDDGGVGGGGTDILIDKLGKRKVRGLNNSSKSISGDKKKILKEDLYSHSIVLMEQGKIELISDLKLLRSLKSITFEYTDNRNIKIKGNYSHLAEAFVRANWCLKEKGLNIFLA